jgi:hypothetical protein
VRQSEWRPGLEDGSPTNGPHRGLGEEPRAAGGAQGQEVLAHDVLDGLQLGKVHGLAACREEKNR